MITTICYVEVCIVKARAESCEPLRRGRQDIIMGILTIAKHGARKTEMIDKVRLSSAQCAQYLVDLKGEVTFLKRAELGEQPKKDFKSLTHARSAIAS